VARLGTVRLRHGDSVNGLAFSPDGKTLASCGDDGRVLLWDVASGKELRELSYAHAVGSVLFSFGGKALVSVARDAEDPRIQVRDVRSGEVVRSLELPEPDRPVCVAAHPDGKTLFAASGEGLVCSWDLASGKELWRGGRDGEADCHCLALSPDGKTLAAGSASGKIEFRDAGTGKLVKRLATAAGDILSLAFSPDGRTLALADLGCDLKCLDLARGKSTFQAHLPHFGGGPLAFAPDGKRLACGGVEAIAFFDPAGGKEVARLQAGDCYVRGVAFSPDGRYFASAGNDNAVRVWDAATFRPPHPFAREPGGRYCASFRHKGRLVARTAGGVSERDVPFDGGGCLSPDGKVFAGEGEAGRIHLVDANSGKALRTVGREGKYFTTSAIDFSPDGSVVAVVTDELGADRTSRGERLDRLRLWEVATGKLVASPIEGKELSAVRHVGFSPRGRLLVAEQRLMDAGASILLWHYRKGQPLRRLSLPELRDEFQPAVSADGWLLVTRLGWKGGEDRLHATQTIRIREVVSGKEILSLADQPAFSRVALSPDNRLVAVSDANSIRLVEVASGKELRRLRGHRGEVASLEFSPDGDFLVSGSDDTTALVWDVRACLPEKAAGRAERLSESLWDDLAGDDAVAAFRAMQILANDPEGGVALLRRRLRPVPRPDPRAVRALIAELDNDRFDVRERAEDSLRDLDRSAAPLLQESLKTPRSVETRRRLERLLADTEEPRNSPRRLRELRAVHCLTAIGSGPARQLLQTLAEGAPEALLTQQARDELEWLKRQ
jgi:WD40 repeat protein